MLLTTIDYYSARPDRMFVVQYIMPIGIPMIEAHVGTHTITLFSEPWFCYCDEKEEE